MMNANQRQMMVHNRAIEYEKVVEILTKRKKIINLKSPFFRFIFSNCVRLSSTTMVQLLRMSELIIEEKIQGKGKCNAWKKLGMCVEKQKFDRVKLIEYFSVGINHYQH